MWANMSVVTGDLSRKAAEVGWLFISKTDKPINVLEKVLKMRNICTPVSAVFVNIY